MGASFLNLVATKVTVKGEEQKFVSLHLRQGFNRHHTFTVVVNYLSPNNTFQQTLEKFIGYIGETASISFVHRQTGESYDFEGIITQVEMVGSMGETGGVAIHGTSPTILYENNRTLDSWMDQSLSTIIKEATQEYGKVNLVSNPKYAAPIPYMAQYNESVFDFMNRLSALYGEWFYYDGTKVYFGKPDRDNTEKIVYDMDLEEVRLVANLVPGKSARYDYVAQENKQHNADTPAKPDGMNDLQSIAHSCSEKAYTAKTTSAADPHVTDKAELDEQMRIVKNASGANLLNIKGIGKTCRIRIGEIIDVSFPDRMKLPPLGKFRIVGIEHEVRRDGHYSNSFVGVPDSTVHIPVPDAKRPLALPELATVKENNDDKGQGRVKVAFDWQKNGKTTNWIRVQTPNAGVSGAVPKNRGWVFVPEVGDQVMVSYEHGNPDRPYVTGSVFHSGSGKGGDKDNKVKSIITRSGNAIVFDDETGSIVITDQTGKQLIMLDGTDAITVMAKKSITLTNEAESVIVMDDKSIGLQADTIALEGRKSVTLLSGNECMVLSSEKSIISSSGTNIKQEAAKDYDVAAKNGTVNGVNLMIEGKGNVTVSGGIVKFNS
ncbi:phage baseplate assembly protein V [Phocaeicola vulgatus]|jgi:type VI secretion system secreted protein VgrG|uniref:Type IV secretion protein Rhs n=1 Tax=Bacteroides uniformis TaxID=820 RepID=A0A3E5EQX9_BACUN|nr:MULTISPECIES: phage baseplate assembly protein V [Bacteroidales]RGN78420.1 type IV secretion protein Rhs [Bacteroides sp. 4_1_36]MBU9061796.1 type IV secretion protein Rhs [Parabacteroides merdae]MBV4210170.1 type IV secretion protein Rhs [Phocaeicola vulgatus]MBV4214523.1 type IV secretion protein Rhs [Phocaeicola vulgatus]MBX9055552.1 type IV secretion protein Rhs [Parabacteroides merdae]